MRRALPFLRWPRPNAHLLRGEALAGLTVGLMVLPQGVAYAALAGMPLVTGIYAAMLPALVAVLFSASPRLSVGPTALTCLLVGTSLSGLAEPGSARWVELVVWLSFMTGVLQVVLGLVRFGWLLNLVSAPVLMAFTQAAALLIIASQLPALLGFQEAGHGLSFASFLQVWQGLDARAAGFGLVSLVLLMAAKKLRPGMPAVLVLVTLAAGVSAWIGFAATGGAVVGPLPQGLPVLALPGWLGLDALKQLLLPMLVITLVSFLETASSAKVDNEQGGQRWDQDQDLIGQGLGKLASGLCGSFPTSSSFSRSALTLYAGARTGWATVFSVGVVLLLLMLFTPVLQHVPKAVLAAIVIVAVLGLIKPRDFLRLWRMARTEALIATATLLITLLSAPRLYWGVLAGILMAFANFLYQRLHPRIIEVGLHEDGSLRDRHVWHLPALAPDLYAWRMDAALDFASASSFERALLEYLGQHPNTRQVCLFAQPINSVDATGVELFVKLSGQLRQREIVFHISGMKLPFETALRKAGELHPSPWLHLHRTDADALTALQRLKP
jgi:sulfate permease, SulP family